MQSEEDHGRPEAGTPLRARLDRIAFAILAVGLIAAVVVYFAAAPDDAGPAAGYEINAAGNSYAVGAADSKRYERGMEQMGGKANVLAAQFGDWLGTLWHGRRLAYTLAVVSVSSYLALYFLDFAPAPQSSPDKSSDR